MGKPSPSNNIEYVRKNYSVLENFIYLNSCSAGLFSKEVVAYRRQLDEAFQQNGSNFRAGVYNNIKKVKKTVADTFVHVSIDLCLHEYNEPSSAISTHSKYNKSRLRQHQQQ